MNVLIRTLAFISKIRSGNEKSLDLYMLVLTRTILARLADRHAGSRMPPGYKTVFGITFEHVGKYREAKMMMRCKKHFAFPHGP